MNWASQLVKTISGLELSPNYAYMYIAFVVMTIAFIVWVYYFAVFKKGAKELSNITWLSLKETLSYTTLTIFTIVTFSTLLFGYDFLLDKIVNIIVQNAK
jgi:preprotein translocase SecE subunit